MARRNLTIQLDDGVIKRAKVLAAKRGTSISAMVATQLEELVEHDTRYEEAHELAAKWLEAPRARGGRTWTRDDLYDRSVMTRG